MKQGERLEWLTIPDQPVDLLWQCHIWSQGEEKAQQVYDGNGHLEGECAEGRYVDEIPFDAASDGKVGRASAALPYESELADGCSIGEPWCHAAPGGLRSLKNCGLEMVPGKANEAATGTGFGADPQGLHFL